MVNPLFVICRKQNSFKLNAFFRTSEKERKPGKPYNNLIDRRKSQQRETGKKNDVEWTHTI